MRKGRQGRTWLLRDVYIDLRLGCICAALQGRDRGIADIEAFQGPCVHMFCTSRGLVL